MKKFFYFTLIAAVCALFLISCTVVSQDSTLTEIETVAEIPAQITISDTMAATTQSVEETVKKEPEKIEPYVISKLVTGMANDCKAKDEFVYLTTGHGTLYIIDVKDKKTPTIIGEYADLNGGNIALLQNDFVYVNYFIMGDWNEKENRINTISGFKIIDVTDKNNPELAGDYKTESELTSGFAIQGDYAYLNCNNTFFNAINESTLEIVDITDKKNPTLKGFCVVDGVTSGLSVSGNYAYINSCYLDAESKYLDKSNFFVCDITDKSKPSIIGSCEVPASSFSVSVKDKVAYLTSSKWDEKEQKYKECLVQLVDISDSKNPVTAGKCALSGGAWEMDLKDNLLFVSCIESGFAIIDIKDIHNPYLLTTLETGGDIFDITISGDYAYLAAGQQGLIIVGLYKNN